MIDEIYKVLRTIQTSANPPRVHELLQELRDISSMAMEYFEEKVAPTLKMKLTSPANFLAAAVGVNMSRHSQCRFFYLISIEFIMLNFDLHSDGLWITSIPLTSIL